MDITFFVALFVSIYIMLMPQLIGWSFILSGMKKISDFNPELDKKSKKGDASLDIILGIALLLFQHLFFWLAVWPMMVLQFNLNLPTF